MNDLDFLVANCKCGIHITVNRHRDYYQSAKEALEEYRNYECPPEVDDEVRQMMIDTNTIVNVQFYPDTPIGSYDIYHYDINEALKKAASILRRRT